MENSVAVIGIACQFPGSDNLHEFWETLIEGKNHVTVIPKDRWKVDCFYEDNADSPGKMYTNKGAFLNGYFYILHSAGRFNIYYTDNYNSEHVTFILTTYTVFTKVKRSKYIDQSG